VTVLDILSALILSTCDTKGPVMTAKQIPWIRPWGSTTGRSCCGYICVGDLVLNLLQVQSCDNRYTRKGVGMYCPITFPSVIGRWYFYPDFC